MINNNNIDKYMYVFHFIAEEICVWKKINVLCRVLNVKEKKRNFKMPILFCVVARGTTVLAKYASCAGNFTEVTDQILSKISPGESKLTYSHGRYVVMYR